MQIQQISNTNFRATRVLTTKRILNAKPKTIEVFRLNRDEDFLFIKRCVDLFAKNKKQKWTMFEKRCKSLFSDFLTIANASSEDYYIAVKNNETIVGIMNSLPFAQKVIPLNLFTRQNSPETTNTMFYSFLKDSQRNYNGYNIDMSTLSAKTGVVAPIIKSEEINSTGMAIKKELSKINFTLENVKGINLDDVFCTGDFENEIYPNLK